MRDGSPKKAIVYPGCILSVVVNAIATVEIADYAHLYQWDEDTFLHNGGDGCFAAITFRGEHLVGTFFDHESPRSPFRCGDAFDVNVFFRGMPASHQSLAERCLMYWHSELGGKYVPDVTAACWDEGEYLATAEPWEDAWSNGVHVIRRQLISDLEVALAEWKVNFMLLPEQIELARSLFQRKMAHPSSDIDLTPAQVQFLRSTAGGPNDYEAGRRVFAAIRIHMPPWEGAEQGQ